MLTTFQAEAARIISDPNMKGVVSDAARHEIQSMSPDNMSVAQARRVINRIFVEMDLRKQNVDNVLSGATGNAVVGGKPPAEPSSKPKLVYDPASGTFK